MFLSTRENEIFNEDFEELSEDHLDHGKHQGN